MALNLTKKMSSIIFLIDEIYIKVPMKTLIDRDQKKLYSRALKGEVNNVMGIVKVEMMGV